MRAIASLALNATSKLRFPRALPAGRATLGLAATARLRYPTRIRGRSALGITAAALAPRGLGARLVVRSDRYTKAVLNQVIQAWVKTQPPGLVLSLRIDDGPELPAPFAWDNPHSGLPGVYTLTHPALPTDGFTHYVTVGARRETAGRQSAWARYTFPAQLAAAPVPQPAWVAARLLRQNTAALPDLVEITWRAATAVTLIANLRPRGFNGAVLTPINVRLGAAGPDEGRLLVEGLGPQLKPYYNFPCAVYLGVIGIAHGQESPALWCQTPLAIIAAAGAPDKTDTVTSPDTLAGTAVFLELPTSAGYGDSNPLQQAILAALTAAGPVPANASTLIDQAWAKFWVRLKTRINANMTIHLADFGSFSSTFTSPSIKRDVQTGTVTTTAGYRQPTFKPALAFKVGTKLGRVMTDAEAQELL